MSDARGSDLLTEKNWHKWREEILDKGLEFGDAGRSVRLRKAPDFRMPQLQDERFIATGEVFSREVAAERVARLVENFVAEGHSEEEATLRATALFEPVFENEAEYVEARKLLIRKKDRYADDKAKFLAYILGRLSESSRNSLRARPEFSVARDEEDLLEIWKLLESIHGERGVFSDVLVSQKLYSARQGTRSFEAYVIYFQDLINTLTLHDAAPSARDQTIMFLHSINRQPFQHKIQELLTTIPLPSLSEVISQLSAQKLTERVLSETSGFSSSFKSSEAKKRADPEVFKTDSKSDSSKAQPKRPITCFNCDEAGHLNRECPKPRVTCSKCGKDGHLDKYCKDVAELLKKSKGKKNKERDVSLIVREDFDEYRFCGCIVSELDDEVVCDVIDEHETNEFAFLESQAVVNSDLRVLVPRTATQDLALIDDQHSLIIKPVIDIMVLETSCNSSAQLEIIMDSASQENVINNTKLFANLQPINNKIKLIGIGGHAICATHRGNLKEFDIEALYAPEATNNILSIPRMVDSGYMFWIEHDAMQIYLDGTIHSTAYRNQKGFWTLPANLCDTNVLLTLLDRHFTPEQIDRAKRARQLHVCMGHLSDESLCVMLDNGNLINCAVTSSDVRNASIILGSCDACTAGKITTPSFKSSPHEPASTVGEHLYMDLLEVKERTIGGYLWFLVSVDEFSSYLSIVGLKSKHTGSVEKGIKSIISLFNAQGHRVVRITTDAERTLISAATEIGNLGVQLTETIPYEHEKRVERYIRTIKDRKRTIMASLSYVLPSDLHGELLQYIVTTVNLTPNSVSGTRLPYEIFYGKKPDLSNMALLPFGQPLMVKTLTSADKDAPRAEYGIALGWKLQTPGAIKVYIPHRKFIAIRNIRSIKLVESISPEWKWTAQIPARSFSAPTTLSATPPVLGAPNTPVQSSVPEYEEQDLPLPRPPLETVTPESSTPSLPQEGDGFTEPVLDLGLSKSASTTAPHDDKTVHDHTGLSTDSNIADADDVPLQDNLQDKLSIKINRALWDQVKLQTTQPSLDSEEDLLSEEDDENSQRVLHISVEAALRTQHSETVGDAVKKELFNMIDNDVWSTVDYDTIIHKDNIIPSHMFIKFKHKPDGSFDKTKARLVVQGNHEPDYGYGKTALKTINNITVFILFKIMTVKDLKSKVYDIPGAYLKTFRNHPIDLFIKLSPAVANNWVELRPEDKKLLYRGCLYAKLKKCIYGLKEAAYEFYVLLSTFLISIGFIKSEADECLYYLHEDDENYLYVITHVDDLLAVGLGRTFHYLETRIEERFGTPDIQFGNKLFYLGMTVERDRNLKTSSISQHGCIEDLLIKYDADKSKEFDNPCAYNFMENDDSSPECNKTVFLSLCMSLMYIARMTRPDILFAVSYLATKSSHPTEEHLQKLRRVLLYLKGTANKKMVMNVSDLSLNIYADASFGIHHDGKSHTGIEIAIGKDPIFVRSSKQHCVSLSSTEAELIALTEAITYLEWIEKIFSELRVILNKPAHVFQDNQSAIHMVNNDFKFKNTKHMTVKVYFARELVQAKRVVLQYLPTDEMSADILTKPLNTKQFVKLVAKFVL